MIVKGLPMSIQGKKIAQINMAFELSKAAINTSIQASKLDGFTAAALMLSARAQCQMIMGDLNATPHQYFNDQGKIDKRKVKRYNRKTGNSNTYLL